jgi:HEAT repeat protein
MPEENPTLEVPKKSLEEISPALLQMFKMPDEVRAAAALTLAKIGGTEAHDVLKKLSKDSSMLVRSSARKALGGAA